MAEPVNMAEMLRRQREAKEAADKKKAAEAAAAMPVAIPKPVEVKQAGPPKLRPVAPKLKGEPAEVVSTPVVGKKKVSPPVDFTKFDAATVSPTVSTPAPGPQLGFTETYQEAQAADPEGVERLRLERQLGITSNPDATLDAAEKKLGRPKMAEYQPADAIPEMLQSVRNLKVTSASPKELIALATKANEEITKNYSKSSVFGGGTGAVEYRKAVISKLVSDAAKLQGKSPEQYVIDINKEYTDKNFDGDLLMAIGLPKASTPTSVATIAGDVMEPIGQVLNLATTGRLMSGPYVAPKAEDYTPEAKAARAEKTAAIKRGMGFGEPVEMKEINDELELGMYRVPTAGLTGGGMGGTMPSDLSATRGADATAVASELLKNAAVTIGDEQAIMRIINQNNETGDWQKASSQIATEFVPVITKMHPELNVDEVGMLANRQALRLMAAMRNTGQWSSPIYITREDWDNGELKRVSLPNPANDVEVVGITSNGQIISRQMTYAAALANTITGALEYGVVGGVRTARQMYNDVESASKTYQRNLAEGKSYAEASAAMLSQLEGEDTWGDLVKNTQVAAATQADLISEAATYAERNQLTTLPTTVLVSAALAASVFMPDIGEVGLAAKERYVGDFNRQSILAKTQAINPKWVEPVDAMMDAVLKIPGMDYLSLGSAAAPVRTLDAGVDAANKGQELWFEGKREEAIASFEEAEARSESILRNQSSKVERDVEVKNADGSTRIEKQFIDAGTGRLIMETVDRLEGELTRKVIESRGASKNVETVVAANDLYDYKVANALNRLGQAVKNKWSMDVNLSNLVRRTSTQSYATRFGVASDLKALVAFDAKAVDAAVLADLSRAEILRGISAASIRDGLKDFEFNSLLASKAEDVPQILFDYLQTKGYDFEANPKSLADITKDTETLLGRIKKEAEISTLLEDKDALVNRAINSVILQREIRTTASSVVSHVARRTGGKQMTAASAMDEKLLGEKNDLSVAEATRVAHARVNTKTPKISMVETLKMRFGLKPDETKLSASARKHLDEVMKFVGENKEEAITLLLLADARARVVSNISGRPMDAWWRQTIQDIRVLKGEGTIAGSGKLAAKDLEFTGRTKETAPVKLQALVREMELIGYKKEEIATKLNTYWDDNEFFKELLVLNEQGHYDTADMLGEYRHRRMLFEFRPQVSEVLARKMNQGEHDLAFMDFLEAHYPAELVTKFTEEVYFPFVSALTTNEPYSFADLILAMGNDDTIYEGKSPEMVHLIRSMSDNVSRYMPWYKAEDIAEFATGTRRSNIVDDTVAQENWNNEFRTRLTEIASKKVKVKMQLNQILAVALESAPKDGGSAAIIQSVLAKLPDMWTFEYREFTKKELQRVGKPALAGWADSDNRSVVVSPVHQNQATTLVHEAIHAVTVYALRLPITKERMQFAQEVNRLRTLVIDKVYGGNVAYASDEHYGLTDEFEFAAEALSNPQFQALLKSVPDPKLQGPITAWQRFAGAIAELLGLSKNETNVMTSYLKAHEAFMEFDQSFYNQMITNDEWGNKLFSKETASPVSAKGSVEFNTRTGAAIIEGYARADASTFVHELAHVIRSELSPSDMDRLVATLRDEYGIEVNHDGRGNFIDIESIDVDEPTVSIDEDSPTVVEPEVEVVEAGDVGAVGDEDKDTPTVVSSPVPEDEDPKTTVMSDTDRAKALTANYNARKINALTTPIIPDKLVKTTPEAQRKANTIAASIKAASARVDELKASLAEFDTDEMKTTKAFKETTKKLDAAETRLAEVLESESPILNARVAYTKAEAKYSIAKNAAEKAIKSYELRRDGDIAVKSGEKLGDFKAKAEEAIEEALARRTELSETIVLWEDAMKTEAAKVSPNAVAKVTAAQKARLELEERKAAEVEKASQKAIKAEVAKKPEVVQEVKEANVVEEKKVAPESEVKTSEKVAEVIKEEKVITSEVVPPKVPQGWGKIDAGLKTDAADSNPQFSPSPGKVNEVFSESLRKEIAARKAAGTSTEPFAVLDVMGYLQEGTMSDVSRQILKSLSPLISWDTTVFLCSPEEMFTLVPQIPKEKYMKSNGVYLAAANGSDVVWVNTNTLKNPVGFGPQVEVNFMHELTHAATVNALRRPKTQREIEFSTRIKSLHTIALEYADKNVSTTDRQFLYGLKNDSEFVAEIFSNVGFCKFLDTIPTEAGKTVWTKLLETFLQLFGLDKNKSTVLSESLAAISAFIKKEEVVPPKAEMPEAAPETNEMEESKSIKSIQVTISDMSDKMFNIMSSMSEKQQDDILLTTLWNDGPEAMKKKRDELKRPVSAHEAKYLEMYELRQKLITDKELIKDLSNLEIADNKSLFTRLQMLGVFYMQDFSIVTSDISVKTFGDLIRQLRENPLYKNDTIVQQLAKTLDANKEAKVIEPEVVTLTPPADAPVETKVDSDATTTSGTSLDETKNNAEVAPQVAPVAEVKPEAVVGVKNKAFEQRNIDSSTAAIMRKSPFAELSDKAEAAVRVRAIVELMRGGSLESMKDSVNYGAIADVLRTDGVTIDSVIGTLKDEINSIYGINISGFEHKTKGGKKLFQGENVEIVDKRFFRSVLQDALPRVFKDAKQIKATALLNQLKKVQGLTRNELLFTGLEQKLVELGQKPITLAEAMEVASKSYEYSVRIQGGGTTGLNKTSLPETTTIGDIEEAAAVVYDYVEIKSIMDNIDNMRLDLLDGLPTNEGPVPVYRLFKEIVDDTTTLADASQLSPLQNSATAQIIFPLQWDLFIDSIPPKAEAVRTLLAKIPLPWNSNYASHEIDHRLHGALYEISQAFTIEEANTIATTALRELPATASGFSAEMQAFFAAKPNNAVTQAFSSDTRQEVLAQIKTTPAKKRQIITDYLSDYIVSSANKLYTTFLFPGAQPVNLLLDITNNPFAQKPHFGSVNFAHVRGTTQVINGKNYFFLQEIQSDVGQDVAAGRTAKPERMSHPETSDWTQAMVRAAVKYAVETGHEGIILPQADVIMPYNLSLPKELIGNEKAIQDYLGPPSPKGEKYKNKRDTYEGATTYYKNLVPGIIQKELASKAAQVTIPWKPSNYNKDVTSLPELNISATEQATLAATADVAPTREGITTIKAAADHMEDVLQKAASAVLSEDIRTNLHRVRDRISLRKMNFEFAVMQMGNIYSPESKISIPAKLLKETNDLGAAMRDAAELYARALKQTAPQDKSFSAQAIDFTPEIKSKYAKPQPLFQPEPDASKPGIRITIDDSKYSEEVRRAEEAWAEVIESVFKNKELPTDAPPIFGQVADVVRQYVNETARTVDEMIPENNIRDQFMDQFDPKTASTGPFGKTVINPLNPDADLKALFNDVDLTNPMAAQEAMTKRLKAIKNELTNFPERQPQELLDEQDLIERRLAAIKQTPEYKTALLRELKKKLADDTARYGNDIPSYVASKMDKLRKKIDFLEKDLITQEMPSPLPFDGMQTDEALNLAATEIAKTVPEKTLSDKFFQQMVNSPKWATIGGFFTGFGADEKWAQRAIPPEARTTFMTAIRPIQETISDISRLITEGSENLASTKKTLIEAAQSGDVKATSVFEYLNGRQTKFGSGMPTVTSGINHVDWATARIQSKWHAMDIADQNLVQRYFDACGVDANGNAKTYVSGLDANTASAAAAILNKLLSDADRSDARSNAANPGDLFLGMAKQSVWPNIGVEDAPKLHAWLMSLFHAAEVITPTNKEGYTVIADNAMRLVSALSYNVSSNIEAPHHAAVWLATHGGLQHSRSAIKNQAFGVPKEDAVMFDKWKRGQFDPKMDYAKMDSIVRKYGLTATFELAPELGINDVMLPSKLRAEIRNELLHGRRLLTSDEQLALQFGADPQKIFAGEYKSDFITDVLSGIVMGIRKSSVLGLFFNRPQGFTNDAIGIYDAVANNSRFKTAAAATIQRSLQLAITNTPILSDLLDALGLAARFTGSDNRVAKIQTKIRQALSNAGDNVSKAIISSASAARSLPLVTEIIDGSPDKYIEVNGTRYTHYDLRQIWLQEGVFATFERGQTSEALFNEVTPKTGLSAEKRLRRAANTFSRYRYEQSNEAGTFVRVGVASAYLQMGYDPRTAARAAVATTFDYVNSTTGWDKNLIYNVFFPFQAFRKNNARFIMNRLTTYSSIRKIAMTYRLLTGIPDAFEALAIAEQREDGNEYGVKVNELNEDSMEEFEQMRLILEEGYSPMFGTDAAKWPDDVKSHIAGTPEAFNSQWASMDEKGKNLLVYGYGGYANVPLDIKQSMNMFFSGATRIVSSEQPSMLERRRMQANEDIIRKDSNIPVDEDAFASRNRFMYDYQLNRPSGTFSIESGPKVDAIRNRADQQSIRQRGGTGTDSTPAIVGSLAETMFMSQANVLGVGMAAATLTYRAGEALGEYAFDATDEDLARWKANPSGTFEEEDIEPDRSSPYYSIGQFLDANAGTLKQINDPERTALIGDILKMQAGEERAALLHPLVGQVLAAAPGGFGVTIDTSGVEPKYYLTPEGKLALTVSLRTFPIELSNMLLRTESVIDVTREQPKTQSAAAVQDTIARGDYADPATVLYILKSAGFQVSEQAPSSVMSAVQPRWSEKTSTPK